MQWLIRAVISLGLTIGVLLGVWVELGASQLDPDYVRQAKEKGWPRVDVRESQLYASDVSLKSRLDISSIVVLHINKVSATQVIGLISIHSWHVFKIDEVIRSQQRQPNPANCATAYRGPSIGRDEIAIEFFGGSTVVDRIPVAFHDQWDFEPAPGQRYLAFVTLCTQSAGSTLDGPYAWFDLSQDGRISSKWMHQTVTEIVNLGTVQAVKNWAKQ